MDTNRKITSHQVVLLIIAYRSTIAFSYLPVVNTPPGNQDVWIVLLLSIPYTILICAPILFLSNKFNDLTLIEYMEKILGGILGKIVGIYYTMYFLVLTIYFVSVLTEILNTTMFPETPTWITVLIMIMTCAYVSYKGLSNIGRGAEVMVPFIIAVILILSILGCNKFDFKVLLPILKDSSFKQINIGAIDIALKFSDILILAMITPYLYEREKLNNIFYKSLIFSILIVIVVVIVSQATLGIEQAKHAIFPFFTYARLIDLFNFIQRIEAIFVVVWISANIGKIAGYLYFTSLSFSQVLKKSDNRPYIIPSLIIIFILTILVKNRRSVLGVKQPFEIMILIFSLISILIIPLIVLIVYLFRKKNIKAKL